MPTNDKANRENKTSATKEGPKLDSARLGEVYLQTHPATIIQRTRLDPNSLTPGDVLRLQRTLGNRAVGGMLVEREKLQTRIKGEVTDRTKVITTGQDVFRQEAHKPERREGQTLLTHELTRTLPTPRAIQHHSNLNKTVQRALGYHVIVDENVDDDKNTLPVFDAKNGQPLDEPEYYIYEAVNVIEEDDNWVKIIAPDTFDKEEAVWTRAESLKKQPRPAKEEDDNVDWEMGGGRLYGRNRRAKMSDVHQGNLSDCFLLAPLAAIVATQNGKQLIKKIIQSRGDGTYVANFFSLTDDNEIEGESEEVEVDKLFPTRGEHKPKFLYNSPDKQIKDVEVPLWAALLEKAYAAWATEEDPLDEEEVSGYEDLEEGTASRAIAHLIGIEPEHIQWDSSSKTYLKDVKWRSDTFESELEEDEAQDTDSPIKVENIQPNQLLRALGKAKADPTTFVVAESQTKTGDDKKYLDKGLRIKDTHVYVVMGTNTKDRTVRLWDPAHDHPGSIPIADFQRLFTRVLKASTTDSPLSD